MIKDFEFSKGVRHIVDALFIKNDFIPLAVANERWSVAVYEAHRALELLLRGLIIFLGGNPFQKKHDLEGLVLKFEHCLMETRSNLPFSVGYYSPDGNAYGVRLKARSVELVKRINDVFTVVMSAQRSRWGIDSELIVGLEVVDRLGSASMVINGEIVGEVQVGNAPIGSALIQISRQFSIKPESQRFIELKTVAKFFNHILLLDARY